MHRVLLTAGQNFTSCGNCIRREVAESSREVWEYLGGTRHLENGGSFDGELALLAYAYE